MAEEDGKGGKMPRLTIMEEVLLLGLKDKQVRPTYFTPFSSLHRTELRRAVTCPQRFPYTLLLVRRLRAKLTCRLSFLGIPLILE